MVSINFWPVLVSAVVALIIGSFWYSPILFGKIWMSAKGFDKIEVTPEMRRGMWKSYLAQLISSLVMFLIFGFLTVATASQSAGDGLMLAFVIWLGFKVTASASDYLWNRTPMKLILVGLGGDLVTLLAGGAIIGGWR